MDSLAEKISQKKAVIGVIGLGHTGLFLANEFHQKGFHIIGYDIDLTKIEKLKRKENYLPFFDATPLFNSLESKKFIPTEDPKLLASADVLIISVPTPLDKQRMPDLMILQKAAQTVSEILHKGQLVIMQSTSFPGTVEELILPILAETGLEVGEDFFLAHVPEREDAGNPSIVLSEVPRLVGGVTLRCRDLAKSLYEHITIKMVPCSSVKVAEAAKVYENAYRLINIAFANEMKVAFDRMGIDCWEVIEMASTKPFGFTPFYPGPGIGGECIPVDPIYFAWKAKQYDAPTAMIDIATLVNIKTSNYVVHKTGLILNEHQKALNGAKILLIGMTFKKNVYDVRESPGIKILTLLRERGATVAYSDPFIPKLAQYKLESVSLDPKTLSEFDCAIIVTDHDQFDWKLICEHSQLIIDTRNVTRPWPEYNNKIIR